MKNQLSVNHLLGIKYLQTTDIDLIFETANEFKDLINRPIKKVPSLRDITIANLFFENSTRTKLSFELAQKRLSADIVNFSSTSSSLSKGESLIDTLNNILAMKVDIVVLRHPMVGAANLISNEVGSSIIINAGDGTNEHPTQALLDVYSLKEKFGKLKGVKVLIVGDILHSRVALSNILLLKKMEAEVCVCGPKSLMPKYINSLGVEVTYQLDEALQWADAVITLRVQNERMQNSYFPSDREYSKFYGINKQRLSKVKKELVFLHPGPINRGVEIASEVADSEQAIILNQVENGVAIRMAVTYLLAYKITI